MITQHPFQLSQQISQNAPRDTNGAKLTLPGNAIAWRLRPNWFGQNCVAVDPGDVGAWDPQLDLSTQVPIPGAFPIELTVNGAPFTLDNAEWQTTPTGNAPIIAFTDAMCEASFTDVPIAGSAEVFFSDNWIAEYATETTDLLLPAPSKRKSIPKTSNLEILVPTTPEIIAGPFLGNNAQATLQNLGPNAVWLIVCGAWGAAQFSVAIPDPNSKGQLLGPGGSYVYSRMAPGTCIVAACPGGAQVAGSGTRVVVIDK